MMLYLQKSKLLNGKKLRELLTMHCLFFFVVVLMYSEHVYSCIPMIVLTYCCIILKKCLTLTDKAMCIHIYLSSALATFKTLKIAFNIAVKKTLTAAILFYDPDSYLALW